MEVIYLGSFYDRSNCIDDDQVSASIKEPDRIYSWRLRLHCWRGLLKVIWHLISFFSRSWKCRVCCGQQAVCWWQVKGLVNRSRRSGILSNRDTCLRGLCITSVMEVPVWTRRQCMSYIPWIKVSYFLGKNAWRRVVRILQNKNFLITLLIKYPLKSFYWIIRSCDICNYSSRQDEHDGDILMIVKRTMKRVCKENALGHYILSEGFDTRPHILHGLIIYQFVQYNKPFNLIYNT